MPEIQEKALPPAPERLLLEPPATPPKKRRLFWIGGGILLLFLALFLVGFLEHRKQKNAAEDAARKQRESIPEVNVARVVRAPRLSRLELPGNTTPLMEAYVYARSTGYVRKRYFDIGDRVRAGQVLAEVESPDLDQQVVQAQAQLTQAEHQLVQAQGILRDANARLELAHVTWDRYRVLEAHGAVSHQDADQQYQGYSSGQALVTQAEANVRAAEENIRGNRANLERMRVLQGFEQVRAPFDGVITARNFDVGALVSGSGASLGSSSTPMGGTQQSSAAAVAGPSGSVSTNISPTSPSAGAQGGELFRMAQIGVLRVLADVPEEAVASIHVGQPAEISVVAFGNRPFSGQVTRTSSSVDIQSRTMLAVVQVPNPTGVLLPGMYVQVSFESTFANPPLLIPGDSVIVNADGLQVALATGAEPGSQPPQKAQRARIHMQNIQVGRDYGPSIEVTGGLEEGQYVVVNPADDVREQAEVIPRPAPPLPGQNAGKTPIVGGQESGRIGRPSQQAPTAGKQEMKGGKGNSGGKENKSK